MYKNVSSIAALIFATGYLARSIPMANAHIEGPRFTGGESPWVDFTTDEPTCGLTDVYTVPSDRVLILTGTSTSSSHFDLYVDGTLLVAGNTLGGGNPEVFFAAGNAHIPVAPGSTLQYNNEESPCDSYGRYAIQGYLAHP